MIADRPTNSAYYPSMESQRGTVANLLAATAIGVLQMGVAISLATLIFAGPLADGAGRAASSFLLGTAIVSLFVGAASKMSVVIAGAQDTAAIMVVAVATSIASSTALAPDQALPTVVVMLALTALATGITFLLLGRFGLTSFVRYLPYPVISGFTAGTGWLLLRGGIEVMHGGEVSFGELSNLFSWPEAQFLVPGLGLAAVMLIVVSVERLPNTLVSVAILVGTILFHVVGRSVSSLERLEQDGWLVGPFPADTSWSPVSPSDLDSVNWQALGENAVPIFAVVAVSVIGLLLNLSGLEGGPDIRIDLNREIQAAGAANVLVGATGGLVGYHLIGDTTLARQIGGRGKVVPIAITAMAMVVFLIGPDLIALVPRSVAGGVLAGLGITLLASWFRSSLPLMERAEELLSMVILAIIALFGVLPGVGAGVLVAAGLFVMRYSRINPVRHILDGAGRSTIDRSFQDQQLLADTPDALLVVELQGFLFFGSMTRVRQQIDDRIQDGVTRFVVLDLGRVTGLDSTATTSLQSIRSQLESAGITLVLSASSGKIDDDSGQLAEYSSHRDLDHAIAWCEDHLIEEHAGPADDTLGSAPDLDYLQELPHRDIAAGDTLIYAGSEDTDVFFVETGRLTAWLPNDEGNPVRIRQVQPGAALGEISFSTGAPRSATVVADIDARVRVLSRAQFDALTKDDPSMAIELQNDLLRRLSTRVTTTSAMVRDLLQ